MVSRNDAEYLAGDLDEGPDNLPADKKYEKIFV